MRLLVNTSILRFGGAVQGAVSFIRECRAFPSYEYHVVLGPGVGSLVNQSEFPGNFEFYEKSFGVMGAWKLQSVSRQMNAIESEIRPDCVFTNSGPPYWRSRAPHVVGFNLGLYIYPESPYVRSLSGMRRLRFEARKKIHKHLLSTQADAFVVQTNDVNRRIQEWLRTDLVFTVTNTHSGFFLDPPQVPRRLPDQRGDVFRLLTVTSYYAHKNLEIIPKIVPLLRERIGQRFEFVLTLSPDEYRARIGSHVPDEVRLVGPVPADECPSLYAECDAMFLPTLAECFSASYPEAMVMRKPIVTTDLGFARSICGPAAMYFKPCDAEDAARVISEVVANKELRDKLVEEGLNRLPVFDSPSQRARKVLNVCESMCGRSA